MPQFLAGLVFLLGQLASKPQNQDAYLTVFRELNGHGLSALMHTDEDKLRIVRMRLKLDGKDLAELGDGRFVTLQIAPGRHILTADESWASKTPVVVDLTPGEHLFYRASKMRDESDKLRVFMVSMDCTDARVYAKETKPIQAKKIGDFPAVDEIRFPSCER